MEGEEDEIPQEVYGPDVTHGIMEEAMAAEDVMVVNSPNTGVDGRAEPQEEDDIEHELNEDVERLKEIMLNETNAPEILPYEEELIEEMLAQVENQQNNLDELAAVPDDLTSEQFFTNKLYQMELDRIKYMITTYLRTRLSKIEDQWVYILKTTEMRERLSDREHEYCKRYADIVDTHMIESALKEIPEPLRAIDIDNMVKAPKLDKFVFCETKRDVGEVQVDDRGGENLPFQKDDRHVVRYRSIRSLVLDGSIRLI